MLFVGEGEEDNHDVPGVYECRFIDTTHGKATFNSTYKSQGKPGQGQMKFEPGQDQYSDGDAVNMICSVGLALRHEQWCRGG